jgi:phage tail sheath gpL-like
MPISFSNFPANWRLPLVWVEVDPSKAGFPVANLPALLVGVKLAAGSAPVDVPIAISSQAQADDAFGEGSMLARMFTAFFANNFAHEVYGLPVAEPGAGVTASGTITVTGPATGAGTLYVYIAGQRVELAVAVDDTAVEVAQALVAAINDLATLPVTASAASDGAVVTLTCKWKGESGNDIRMQDNYLGVNGGERMPAGIALAYSGSNFLTGGTAAPDFAAAIANLGDEPYEFVAMPFTDTTSLSDWNTEYGFSDTGRWGWMRQTYGHLFSAYRDTYANLLVWGATQNSGLLSVIAMETAAPSPKWEWSAAYTAKAARALLNDPARPLQTLELLSLKPAPKHQRFSKTELNNLAGNGLATANVNPNGNVALLRESTTYQLNSYGQGDDAYELVTTLATLARLFRDLQHAVTSKWPRHKLADDGTRFGPGQAIVTPKIIKAELIAQYRIAEFNGLVENAAAFKDNLIVERDSNNPNRVSVLYPPDLVNQLRIFAVLGQFRLQYNRGVDTSIL